MVFPHAKEVEDIGLTNQPCKRSKICLVIPKGEAMTHLVLSASFAFLDMYVHTRFQKEPNYQLTTCSTCTVEGKM
jgi:hypothetical protein